MKWYDRVLAKRDDVIPSFVNVDAINSYVDKSFELDQPEMTGTETAADIALGFAPGIGTAMGFRDFERARRDDDKLGMGLGLLSMIPVAGGAVKAGRKGVNRIIDELDMSSAARMKRAREQGFDRTFYHGTHADIDEFDLGMSDIGVHRGTKEQAGNRLADIQSERTGRSRFFRNYADVAEDANIMPLRARIGRVIDLPDVGMWNDSSKVLSTLEDMPEFRGRLDDAWEELGVVDQYEDAQDWLSSPENREMLDEINNMLRSDGYNTVRYQNAVENTYHGSAAERPEVRAEKDALYSRITKIDDAADGRRRPELTKITDPEKYLAALDNMPLQYTPQESAELSSINARIKELNDIARGDSFSYIALDPTNIRSVNAAFDPTKKDSANLLAGLGAFGLGVGGAASMFAPQQANASDEPWYEKVLNK